MSRREDHVSCIDVTIMDRFAHSALPSAYSKEIFAPIRDLGVNRSRSVSMAGALCDSQRGFQVAVKADER
jgi:hypothetical protein